MGKHVRHKKATSGSKHGSKHSSQPSLKSTSKAKYGSNRASSNPYSNPYANPYSNPNSKVNPNPNSKTPFRILPLLVICATLVAAVMAFGSPGLWTTAQERVKLNEASDIVEADKAAKKAAEEEAERARQEAERVENQFNGQVVAEYKSVSQSESTARAKNVQLAGEAINGKVIEPGATFSFNETVGNTAEDTRYEVAPVISDYSMEWDRGGGVCQVSTALYIAALKADLEIVERHAHTIASDYAPIGLDATVSFGILDLRIKNNSDNPVTITATSGTSQSVTVRIVGEPLAEGLRIDAIARIVGQDNPEDLSEDVRAALTEEDEVYVVESYRVYYENDVSVRNEQLSHDTYVVPPWAVALLGEGGVEPTK